MVYCKNVDLWVWRIWNEDFLNCVTSSELSFSLISLSYLWNEDTTNLARWLWKLAMMFTKWSLQAWSRLCPQLSCASSRSWNWFYWNGHFQSLVQPLTFIQFSSVTQSCPTLCDPMNHSTPGLPVHHQHPQSTQTHVHWVGDAIQPSQPLSSPSPLALNPSQHQSLFQWVNSSHEVAKVLEFQLQYQFFQWTPRTDLLRMDWLDLLVIPY